MADQSTVQALTDAIEELREREKKSLAVLTEIQVKLESVLVARAYLTRGTNGREFSRGIATREDLYGLSLIDAAILIAERNDGDLPFTKTRRLMIAADLISANGAGSTRLYTCLSKSQRFERTATKGHYRLLPKDEDQNGQDDDVFR